MKYFLTLFSIIFFNAVGAQQPISKQRASLWQAVIVRADGNQIPFSFELEMENNFPVMHIINGSERIRVDSVHFESDSVFIKMPLYESSIKAAVSKGKLIGTWTKGTTTRDQVLPFSAEINKPRFLASSGKANYVASGKWAVKFEADSMPVSVAEFQQQGSNITGTFMTPTGDYRYLEGIVDGDQIMLSGFDGVHAVLFTGKFNKSNSIENGRFISGAKHNESWTAIKNPKAIVKIDETAMFIRSGQDRLNFRFPDLDSNFISITDNRFLNKVVVIQLMGSWCPNCMDETAFLSEYYRKNKDRGVEIIALAYEYSSDFYRSKKSVGKFQNRFNVQYPILITGIPVSDTMRTEKTLPQLTRIKVFPTSIILDKKGSIRKIDTGFVGPGTGEHYEVYKKEFGEMMDGLLKEE